MIDHLLLRSPLHSWFRWRSARDLAVLAYHDVRDGDRFEEQVRYLTRSARPVTLQEVHRAVEGGTGLPRRSVLVTFDDGDRSVLDTGLPILRRYEVPGVVFVIGGLLDSSSPFWWDEVAHLLSSGARVRELDGLSPADAIRKLKLVSDTDRRRLIAMLRAGSTIPTTRPQLLSRELGMLRSAGIEIGNHTLDHPCLDRCEAEVVRAEILRCHEILRSACGDAPTAFAYPNGNHHPAAEAVLAELGYSTAFLFDHRLQRLPIRDPLRISRLRVNSHASTERLRIILSGLHPAVHRLRGRA